MAAMEGSHELKLGNENHLASRARTSIEEEGKRD